MDAVFEECLNRELGADAVFTDNKTYGKKLWAFLAGVAGVVESHSKDIIPIFLDYIKQSSPSLLRKPGDKVSG